MEEYIKIQSEYISFIGECYDNAFLVANLHHYNESAENIEKGKILREKLEVCEKIFSTDNSKLNMQNVMPPLVGFKERRQKLRLSMQTVTNNTGVSKATISRIERGHKADYENVMKLNNFYASNGA